MPSTTLTPDPPASPGQRTPPESPAAPGQRTPPESPASPASALPPSRPPPPNCASSRFPQAGRHTTARATAPRARWRAQPPWPSQTSATRRQPSPDHPGRPRHHWHRSRARRARALRGRAVRAQSSAGQATALPRKFAQVIVEILAGSRPLRQTVGWTTDRVRAQIGDLTQVLASDQRPRIRRVVTSQPAASVVEMTVVVTFGARSRALAMRFEHMPARQPRPGLPPAQRDGSAPNSRPAKPERPARPQRRKSWRRNYRSRRVKRTN